jgi:mono/diheme cytochrome c family protein
LRPHAKEKTMRTRHWAGLAGLLTLFAAITSANAADPAQIARGRYVALIGGCNDCHTAGFMEKNLAVPETEWLKGGPVGFQGPWGTTYASNLRLVMSRMTEAQWLEHARKERMPPMPAYALHQMSKEDLKALYAYVRSLGDPGEPAPAYVAPGGRVTTPYFVFVPKTDQQAAAVGK